jgi:hypothetical protein
MAVRTAAHRATDADDSPAPVTSPLSWMSVSGLRRQNVHRLKGQRAFKRVSLSRFFERGRPSIIGAITSQGLTSLV